VFAQQSSQPKLSRRCYVSVPYVLLNITVFKSTQNWVGVSDGSRTDNGSELHGVWLATDGRWMLFQAGYYLPDAEVVRENYQVQLPATRNLGRFGLYIAYDCRFYSTYELVRDDDFVRGSTFARFLSFSLVTCSRVREFCQLVEKAGFSQKNWTHKNNLCLQTTRIVLVICGINLTVFAVHVLKSQ